MASSGPSDAVDKIQPGSPACPWPRPTAAAATFAAGTGAQPFMAVKDWRHVTNLHRTFVTVPVTVSLGVAHSEDVVGYLVADLGVPSDDVGQARRLYLAKFSSG